MLLLISLASLLNHRIVFVGGKGGVGKTTIAAGLALAAAEGGRRCLLVSTDPAHSLADIFDRPIGAAERALTAGLQAIEIDPDEEAERHIAAVKTHMKRLVHPRLFEAVDRQLDLAAASPGATEAALIERIAELMGEAGERFDLVIFDTAPTGHTLRLLSLPDVMAAWTDGLLRQRERSAGLASALRRFGGKGAEAGDLSTTDDARARSKETRDNQIRELLLARQRKFHAARAQLLDPSQTAFLMVLNPDKLSILESRKAVASLQKANVPIAGVIVNRVLPPEAEGAFLDARRRQEAEYLAEIDRDFGALPRLVLPLLPHDVYGFEALREIGRRLGL